MKRSSFGIGSSSDIDAVNMAVIRINCRAGRSEDAVLMVAGHTRDRDERVIMDGAFLCWLALILYFSQNNHLLVTIICAEVPIVNDLATRGESRPAAFGRTPRESWFAPKRPRRLVQRTGVRLPSPPPCKSGKIHAPHEAGMDFLLYFRRTMCPPCSSCRILLSPGCRRRHRGRRPAILPAHRCPPRSRPWP